MAGKITDEGADDNIKKWLAQYGTLYLGLYTDTTEPGKTATLLSGMTELAGSGYARIALTLADWSYDGTGLATHILKTFTATGDWGNTYGKFIATTSDNTGLLFSVHTFSNGPYNILDTQTLDITAKLKAA